MQRNVFLLNDAGGRILEQIASCFWFMSPQEEAPQAETKEENTSPLGKRQPQGIQENHRATVVMAMLWMGGGVSH